MASGGYGRGGRGAALLQALNQPARKPGQSPPKPAQQGAEGQAGYNPMGRGQGEPAPTPAMGRGAYLSSLLQGKPAAGGDAAPALGRGMMAPAAGRGIIPQVSPSPGQPIAGGRGYTMMPSMTPSPSSPARGVATPSPQVRRDSPQEQKPYTKSPSPSSDSARSAQSGYYSASPSPPADSAPSSDLESLTIKEKSPVIMKGNSGQPINVAANYIRLICKNKAVYQYAVSFNPMIDSHNMRYKMVMEHQDVIGTTKAFDGAILFLPRKLNRETVLKSTRITDGVEITICIKMVKILPPEQCVTLYNVIFRRIMNILNMCQVGRHYYDPRHPASIPQHRLEVWPGYITAIKEHEGGLLLLADVSHRVLRTETVLDYIKFVVQQNRQNYKAICTKMLVGCTVLTRYNNKTYRIDDIAWDKSPKDEFDYGTKGERMSFITYYQKAYNKTIGRDDYDQPLLIHRPKKKERTGQPKSRGLEVICLIPEFSYMTGLTDDMREDFKVMKDIAVHTRVTPEQRQLSMRKFYENVNGTPEAREQLEKWGLCLDRGTISLPGRLLKEEDIIFRNVTRKAGRQADWGRSATSEQVISAVDLRSWVLVFTSRDKNQAFEFNNMMKKVTPTMGIQVYEPTVVEIPNDRTESFLTAIRANLNQQTQMVVTIFPTSRDDRYSAVKKLCCIEAPVPSQVIISKTIRDMKKLRSVTQKIALQINCKLGGELWGVDMPMKNTMICGIDVYHDGKRGQGKSFGAFVSSLNKMATRWYSRVCVQMPGEELMAGLKVCFDAALKKYHEVNHELPGRIVVFRDGVGDGQLDTVAQFEVQQLASCFPNFGETYQPNLAVVVVQKRINTRIFAELGGGRGGGVHYDNPPPGTIVDHTITRKHWYDFFLVSQHVRQGTVTPTHYIVVHDGSGLKPDQMQRLAYKMTHLYYNWPGTVRVPAPCQYAHKLAYLTGQSIKSQPAMQLSDRLFFL